MLAPLLFVTNTSLRRLYADGFTAGDPVKSDWWKGPASEEPIGGVSFGSSFFSRLFRGVLCFQNVCVQ